GPRPGNVDTIAVRFLSSPNAARMERAESPGDKALELADADGNLRQRHLPGDRSRQKRSHGVSLWRDPQSWLALLFSSDRLVQGADRHSDRADAGAAVAAAPAPAMG